MNVTGSIHVYDNFLLEWAKGNVAPETDTLKAGLAGDGYTPDTATHSVVGDITDELSGNGYAQQTLANVAVSLANNKVKIACDAFAFTASGGNLNARYWFLFDDTHASDILVCYGLIDMDSDEEVTIVNGQSLNIIVNDNGLVRLQRV